LLCVSPHAEFFIGDQLKALRPHVAGVSILIPTPYFAGVAMRLPILSHRFESLRRAEESERGPLGPSILRAKYLDIPGAFGTGFSFSRAARSSVRRVSNPDSKFDLVHAHFIGLCGYVGNEIHLARSVPFVLTAHGGDAYSLPFRDPKHRQRAEAIVQGADRLIAVSRPISDALVTLGADSRKIHIIPNGFDSTAFRQLRKEDARAKLGLPLDRTILLTVANLVPQKGHRYLLESLGRIAKSRPEVLLAIVGGGPLEGNLRSLVREFDLSEKVLFAGPRPHEEIVNWINSCDLFVLPSISEGSPTIIPEVMACGKPIVATRVGGVPDLAIEGETGLLVPPENPQALSDSVSEALARPWDAAQILQSARAYSWDALVPRLLEVYSELAQR